MTARTLVLTPWYFPHKVIAWQEAITLVYLDKVDVVANFDEGPDAKRHFSGARLGPPRP